MRKTLTICAILVVAFSLGGTLLADEVLLQYTGVSNWTEVSINAPNLSSSPIPAEAGVYVLDIDFDNSLPFTPQTIYGYCVEPAYSSTSVLTYDLITVPDNTGYQAAAYLLATYGTPLNAQAPDIQSAIWIVVDGITVNSPSTAASALAAEALNAVQVLNWTAPGWISLAQNPTGGEVGDGAQDYIIRTPEPASILLLGLGLFGVGLVGRKYS